MSKYVKLIKLSDKLPKATIYIHIYIYEIMHYPKFCIIGLKVNCSYMVEYLNGNEIFSTNIIIQKSIVKFNS